MIKSQAKEILSEDIWTAQDVFSYDDDDDIKPPVDMDKLREVVQSYRSLLTFKERRNRPPDEFFKQYQEDIQHILKSYDQNMGRQNTPSDMFATFVALIGNALNALNILNLPFVGIFNNTVITQPPTVTTTMAPKGIKQANLNATSTMSTTTVSSSQPIELENTNGSLNASSISLNGNVSRIRRPIDFKPSSVKCSRLATGSVRSLQTQLKRKKDQQKETKPRRVFVRKN